MPHKGFLIANNNWRNQSQDNIIGNVYDITAALPDDIAHFKRKDQMQDFKYLI